MDDVRNMRERVLAAIRGRGDNAAFDALLSDGLLRTGVEQECVEACKLYQSEWGPGPLPRDDGTAHTRAVVASVRAGRSAIEAERPKERWVAEGPWIRDRHTLSRWLGNCFTNLQARTVAGALNSLEDK